MSTERKAQTWWRSKARPFVGHWWPYATGVLATAVLSISSVSTKAHFRIGNHSWAWNTHLLGLGILLAALSGISAGLRQKRLGKLEKQIASREAAARAGARSVLRLIFKQLDELRRSANHYSNERVSLYRCMDDDHFTLVGRCSGGPTYQNSLGRKRYARDKGCMGEAWRAGYWEIIDLPPAGPMRPWNEDWVAAQAGHGLSRTDATNLTMPSRCYFAFRIEGRERQLGVLVFESVNSPSEVDQDATERALSFAMLNELQRRVSGRLADLLRESAFITDEEVGDLLPQVPIP